VTISSTISQPHTPCESSPAVGPAPTRQNSTPHQPMMQSRHGMAHIGPTQQVQPTAAQSSPCTPIPSPCTQLYDETFPMLPTRSATSWTKVDYKKRPHDAPDTQKQSTKQLKLNDYWLNQPSTSTANKFDVLMEPETDTNQSMTQPPTPKPPPIFVAGVHNIQPLHDLLIEIATDAFELKVLRENQVKIQPKSPDVYRTIIKALAEKHTEFHTYQPKADRSFRTVLRGLHHSTDIKDLRAVIESHGHTVVNIFNITQARSRTPLPLFFIDLKPNKTTKTSTLYGPFFTPKLCLNHTDRNDPSPNAPFANAMDTPKRNASTPRVVSNAPEITLPNTVLVQTDRNQSNVSYVTVLIQPIIKAVLFIKSYSGEHSHLSKGDRRSDDHTMLIHRAQTLRPPMLLFSPPTTPLPSDLPSPQPTTFSHPQQPQSELQDLKSTMKGLMEHITTILHLLTTLVAKLA